MSAELFRRKAEMMDFGTEEELKPGPNGAGPRLAIPITSFTYPIGDDPTTLLGSDDYLGRGGGMFFVSHAGTGKSSWIMDACMSWALGRSWMGIRSNGPLKSLIIQSEDSDRYVGKIQSSFAHVNQLSGADLTLMGNNCLVVRLKGVYGTAFFQELKSLTELHKPDLVVINPIYIYADGDIGRSEFAQPFLVGLDTVNKKEKFAYILVHHTGKPQAKGNNGRRAEIEDWESAYMGFGSSYFANWPRCSALLEPVVGRQGSFVVKLGKGRFNAGITREVPQGAGTRLEAVTRIPIKHSQQTMPVGERSRPVYYWEPDTDQEPEEGVSRKGSGRPEKYSFNDYRNLFPARDANGLEIGPLWQLLMTNKEIKKPILHNCLKRWAEEGVVEIISPPGRPMRYRAAF